MVVCREDSKLPKHYSEELLYRAGERESKDASALEHFLGLTLRIGERTSYSLIFCDYSIPLNMFLCSFEVLKTMRVASRIAWDHPDFCYHHSMYCSMNRIKVM
jgi:hypothetical protein